MLKLSRILGTSGGVLATLPYAFMIAYSVIFIMTPSGPAQGSKGISASFAIIYITPAILSSSGLAASFFVRKSTVAAGVAMILSGALNLFVPMAVPIFLRWPFDSAKVFSSLLLIAAGALALISYKKIPAGKEPLNGKPEQSGRSLQLPRSHRIISVICAALHMLVWAAFSISAFRPDLQIFLTYLTPPFLVSAIGLWGSLLLRSRPVSGAVFMFVSGALGCLIAFLYSSFTPYWWLVISPLPLIAAGTLAIISCNRAPAVIQ
jgi:hypothetical protein